MKIRYIYIPWRCYGSMTVSKTVGVGSTPTQGVLYKGK